MKYYLIGTFAKSTGVTHQMLRNWDKASKLKPSHTGKKDDFESPVENNQGVT